MSRIYKDRSRSLYMVKEGKTGGFRVHKRKVTAQGDHGWKPARSPMFSWCDNPYSAETQLERYAARHQLEQLN